MKKKQLFLWIALFFLFAGVGSASQRPNFVVFIADDLGAEDVGCYGNQVIRTPNIDALAEQSLRFNNAFLTASSCSPSRASLLTGLYPTSTGARNLKDALPPDALTLQKVLGECGYFTGMAGKSHTGKAARDMFTVAFPGDDDNGGTARWPELVSRIPRGQSFFLWLAAYDPHMPHEPGAASPYNLSEISVLPYMLDNMETRKELDLYYREVERFDRNVGFTINLLRDRGLLDNTVVVVMSDNGRPFYRSKCTLYDSGIKTPFLVFWQGKIMQGETDSLISAVDLMPTFLDLAGVPVPDSLEGVSFAPILANPSVTVRDWVFAEMNWHVFANYQRSARSAEVLYIENSLPDKFPQPPVASIKQAGKILKSYTTMYESYCKQTLAGNLVNAFANPREPKQFFFINDDPDNLHNRAGDPECRSLLHTAEKALREHQAAINDVFDKSQVKEDETKRFSDRRE